jgi:hypothetical protein
VDVSVAGVSRDKRLMQHKPEKVAPIDEAGAVLLAFKTWKPIWAVSQRCRGVAESAAWVKLTASTHEM